MRAVDVGVGHDDDLVVAQLLDVEVVAADAGAQRRDQRAHLLAGQHLVEARALDIEDLAAQRQHRLEFAVAALLGRAAGGIALDDEDLGLGGVALLTICELAGQAGDVERALAPRQFARLARGLTRLRRLHHLGDHLLGFGRMFLEPLLQQIVDEALDDRTHFGRDQLVLGLRREFRIGAFDAEHAGQAFAAIVAGEVDLLLLVHARAFGIGRDLARQRAAEADEMRAAVALRDVVGEGQHVLVVAVVPPQRDLDADAVTLALDENGFGDQRRFRAVEIAHEGLQPAFVIKILAPDLCAARVGEQDMHAGIEEGEFAQAMLDRAVIELHHREGLGRGREGDFGAALGLAVFHRRRADDGELVDRVAVLEVDDMLKTIAPDAQLEMCRQRIDDGDADAVQAAGDLVGILVELSAGVQLGHDDLGRGDALFLVDAGGNAAPVVAHRAGAVRVERHGHKPGVTGQSLVDGVVDDLVDHMVQARTVIGVADIHTRALAHRVEAAQNLDRIRAIGVRTGLAFGIGLGLRRNVRIFHRIRRLS